MDAMDVRAPDGQGRRYVRHAFVCTTGSSCPGDGPADEVLKAMRRVVADAGAKDTVRVNHSGCLDQCGHGPNVVVYPEGVWYSHLTVADAERIAREHLVAGRPVDDLEYRTATAGKNKVPKEPGPVGPNNPIRGDKAWSKCGRCPAHWA